MGIDILTTLGPILGGLAGVAAILKILYDNRAHKDTTKIGRRQVEITADDLSMRGEASVVANAVSLAAETREQFEDYREYTDRRFTEMSEEIAKLRQESGHKDERILLLTIDRDTLIQHVLAGGGVPIPDLRTI